MELHTQAMVEQADGAGCAVSLERANKAVAVLAELWGNALFDCGPQDYEFMQSEILFRIDKDKTHASL
jgi:hypothetical protein